jgi:protein CpxP
LTPPFCRFTRGLAPGFRFGVTFASGTPENRIAGKQKVIHNQIRKIMKKRIFAVAAALCLMAGTGAFAQEAKPAAAPKERPTVEQMAQRMTERMQKELKLTDAQAKEVYNLNFQQIKEMQAMREKMQEARKAEAEKMKSILTTEQFVQWSQMQAPRPGERGPQMMHKGDRRGGGKECCDKPCPKKDKKGKE